MSSSIDDIYAGRFLKATNVHRFPLEVHITGVELVEYDDGKKAIGLTFHEFPGKVLGLNKTNVERVRLQLGDDWQGSWPGKTLVLTKENVDFQGKIVEALRIQMPQPVQTPADEWRAQQQAPVQPPAPRSFEQAMHDSGYNETP